MSTRVRAILLAIAGTIAAAGQAITPAANIEAFEKVWTTVRDKHWDPKLGGLDWQAVHDELRPKVEAAKTADAVREILNDMVGRLKQTHFGIFPGDVYHDLNSSDDKDTGDADPGIDLRVLDGHAIVTDVYPGSPAAAKGVKPGWEILRIDETEVAPVVARIQQQFKDSTLLDLRLQRAVLSRLQGSCRLHRRGGIPRWRRSPKSPSTSSAPRRAARSMRLGNLPRVARVERMAPPAAGHRPTCASTSSSIPKGSPKPWKRPSPAAAIAAASCSTCAAIPAASADSRWASPDGSPTSSGLQLGTEYLRGMTLKFAIFPRPEPFRGPLAVLVDGCSASTSEILAGGLKDIGRARLFGTRTAAAALPSVIDRLPNGDGFQYAIANYISQGGKPLEGIGAIPDEEVRLTRRHLLAGKDPALDAAVAWIGKQKP